MLFLLLKTLNFIIISYHCCWLLCRVAAIKRLPARIYSKIIFSFWSFEIMEYILRTQKWSLPDLNCTDVTDVAWMAETAVWLNFFLWFSRILTYILQLLTSTEVNIRIYQPENVIFTEATWSRWISLLRVDKSLCLPKLKSITVLLYDFSTIYIKTYFHFGINIVSLMPFSQV